MSMYNDIVRRSHLPREHAIRRVMAATGIDLTQYGSSSSESLPAETSENVEGEGVEETGESEEEVEHDPCFLASNHIIWHCTFNNFYV